MEDFKAELKTIDNLEDFFKVCGKHYDLKNTKLGAITKGILIVNIDKIIKLTGAKKK